MTRTMTILKSKLVWSAITGALLLLIGLSPTVLAQSQSSDATLSALTLSGVDFGTFASGTTTYTASVANSVTETTVTPTVTHSGAGYVIKLDGVEDSDGEVSLSVGSNVIAIVVTAEDDQTTQTYSVTVTREAQTGICDRTRKVRDAILSKLTNVDACSAVTDDHLGGITGEIDLSEKDIASVRAADFSGLSGLNRLDLSQNDLTSLPAGVFDDLTNLSTLNLSFNDLTSLSSDLFAQVSNLTTLDLKWNDLDTLPADVFDGLSKLRKLNVTLNEIERLPDGVFDDLTEMRELDLGGNYLSSLPDGLFDDLSNLRTLGLGANELSSLRDDVFAEVTNMENLRMHDNELGSLPSSLFDGLSELRSVWVYDNPGAPFPLTAELQSQGANAFKVAVTEGATPSRMTVGLSVSNSSSSLSTSTANIERGSSSSDEIQVTQGGAARVTVTVASVNLTGGSNFKGFETLKGDPLLFVFNNPATGYPTITGTAQVGQTLTASTSGISDADGLTNVVYSYQWLSGTSVSRDTEIDGATNATYTLQTSDALQIIKVRVTFTDDAGNEEARTSAGTEAVVLGGL